MEIFVPASLNHSEVTLSIADSLAKLLDPTERQKIADDIVSYHALNDTEAKKHADALALINQYQGVLDENKRIANKIEVDKAALEQAKSDFDVYCNGERQKIADKWSDVNLAAQSAKDLYAKAEGMINDVASREEKLRLDNLALDKAISANELRAKEIESEYAAVEDLKKEHSDMLEQVKATQAKIASLVIK